MNWTEEGENTRCGYREICSRLDKEARCERPMRNKQKGLEKYRTQKEME